MLTTGAHDDLTNNISISREFESLASLSHTNVVRLIDVGVDESSGQRYLALEWVVSSMDEYLDSGGPEPRASPHARTFRDCSSLQPRTNHPRP